MKNVGFLHVLWNALKNAFLTTQEWKEFEPCLRALCKMIGNKEYKRRLIAKCFTSAPAAIRALLWAFDHDIVDWRWENQSEIFEQMSHLFPWMQKCFDPSVFPSDADSSFIKVVVNSLDLSWASLFLEMGNVICSAVQREFSWVEGCYCHEHILVGASSDSARSLRSLLIVAVPVPVPVPQSLDSSTPC